MPVGVSGEKKRSAVKYETRFAEFEDEKASHVQGVFQGQAAAKFAGLGIATVWRSVALMARWFPARWGSGKRAPESHFGCRDSLSEPSLRWPDPKDLRGTRAGKTSVFLPKEEPREPVQL